MHPSGLNWTKIDQIRRNRSKWTKLDQNGPNWLNWTECQTVISKHISKKKLIIII